jgi:hypothetical protein
VQSLEERKKQRNKEREMNDDDDDVPARNLPPHKMADIGITSSITRKGRPISRKEGKRRKQRPMGRELPQGKQPR